MTTAAATSSECVKKLEILGQQEKRRAGSEQVIHMAQNHAVQIAKWRDAAVLRLSKG
jgi:hypothetical protein